MLIFAKSNQKHINMTQEDLQKYFAEQCSVSIENIIKLGSQQLDRNDYLTVKKVLESRGGK